VFDRPADGSVAAGNQTNNAFGGHRKGRWDLGGIHHAEPAAGARANVDQASAAQHAFRDELHRFRNLLSLLIHRVSQHPILIIQHPHHRQGRQQVNIQRCRVALFGL